MRDVSKRPTPGRQRAIAGSLVLGLLWACSGPGPGGASSLAIAQAPADGWVGRRVVTRDVIPLKDGPTVVDDGTVFHVFTVQQVNGPWLLLKVEGKGVRGWVAADAVVPYEQAIDHFTAEIRRNPSSSRAYNHWAMIWAEKGEHDIAIADYNEAIRLDPSSKYAWSNRGRTWRAKGEHDKAFDDYNQAIRLDPKDASAYRNRGNAWYSKSEYDKAIDDYGRAIRLDPKDAWAYTSRGSVHYDRGAYDQAIKDHTEAIRFDPKLALAYWRRGFIQEKKQEYARAMTDFDEAIRNDPKYINAYNSRAWLWATCPDEAYRDGAKAVESATKACELSGWKDANDLDTLAASYAEAGDFEQAVKRQEEAVALVEEDEKDDYRSRLELYRNGTPYRDPDEPGAAAEPAGS